MANTPQSLMNYIRVIAGASRHDPRNDAQLLTRFVETRDEQAFATLMWRHAPVVWRSCTRVLGNSPDAEDAFQSTFLTMSRKAGKLRADTLIGWLHRVARQAALNVSVRTKRHRNVDQETAIQSKVEDTSKTELFARLDEELAGLPERLRVPLLLHYIEGKSQVEVARILGCARRTLQERLEKGEAILRKRLEQCGLTLGSVALATLLSDSVGIPALPTHLIENTAQAAVAFRSGTLTGTSAEAVEKLLRSLSLKGAMGKSWWLVLACIGTLGVGGAGLVAWKEFGNGSDVAKSVVSNAPKEAASGTSIESYHKKMDCYGDPLPDGAIVRIGTVRFRGAGERFVDSNDASRNCNLQASVALSSDGKTLFLTDGFGIYFWDTATGKQLRKVAMRCENVAISLDCKLLAADGKGISGGWIRLLDTATGQQVGGPLRGCGAAVFAPDGKTIACMCSNRKGGSFYLYDISTRKFLRTIGRELDPPDCCLAFAQFSRDGRTLACIYEGRKASGKPMDLLDVETGKKLVSLEYPQGVAQLVFSPQGNIVTSGKDKVVCIWDSKTGKKLRQLGTLDQVPTVLTFLPDGRTLLAACTEQVRFWDVVSGQESRPALSCKGMYRPIILTADGTKLIDQLGSAVNIWDVATGGETGPTAGAHRSFTKHLAFSPDSTTLVTEAELIAESSVWPLVRQKPGMAALYLWDSATGKLQNSLPVPTGTKVAGWTDILWPSRDTILAQGLYTSGVTEGYQERMTQWTKISPLGGAAAAEVLPSYAGAILSPDRRVLLMACRKGNFELLEVASHRKFADVPRTCCAAGVGDDFGWIHDQLFFSADHRIFATQLLQGDDWSPMIALWDTSTGRECYRVHLPVVFHADPREKPKVDRLIGLSPDGRLIASYNPKTFVISLWEHVSGTVRLRLSMPSGCGDEPSVAFSLDNRLLATSCCIEQTYEKSICVWDLATGRECQCFRGHRAGGVEAPEITFSSDGRRLASAGQDYTALIWDIKQPPAPEPASSKPLDREELQALKTALTGVDAAVAYQAICKLRQVPEQAVPLAAECLRTQTLTSDFKRISQETSLLIVNLDSDDFQTRTKAAQELRKKLSGEEGEPVVQITLGKALSKGKLSIEVNKAIIRLLDELKDERKLNGAKSPELTRMLRGIELLELIHNDSAQKVLQQVVASPLQPEVRGEAEAALKRLAAIQPSVPARP